MANGSCELDEGKSPRGGGATQEGEIFDRVAEGCFIADYRGL